jgi:hypothetical protein
VIARIGGALGLVLLGLAIGTLGAFVQAARWIIERQGSSVTIPWGVLAVWITLLAAVRAGTWLLRTRWGSWAVLAGWLGDDHLRRRVALRRPGPVRGHPPDDVPRGRRHPRVGGRHLPAARLGPSPPNGQIGS